MARLRCKAAADTKKSDVGLITPGSEMEKLSELSELVHDTKEAALKFGKFGENAATVSSSVLMTALKQNISADVGAVEGAMVRRESELGELGPWRFFGGGNMHVSFSSHEVSFHVWRRRFDSWLTRWPFRAVSQSKRGSFSIIQSELSISTAPANHITSYEHAPPRRRTECATWITATRRTSGWSASSTRPSSTSAR